MSRLWILLIVVLSLPMAARADSPTARSFSHSVTTTPSRVEPPDGDKSYVSIRCWQVGPTPVYVGGKDVSPRNGYAICANTPSLNTDPRADTGATCQADFISLDVSDLYAVVSAPSRAPESPAMQSLSCIVAQ